MTTLEYEIVFYANGNKAIWAIDTSNGWKFLHELAYHPMASQYITRKRYI